MHPSPHLSQLQYGCHLASPCVFITFISTPTWLPLSNPLGLQSWRHLTPLVHPSAHAHTTNAASPAPSRQANISSHTLTFQNSLATHKQKKNKQWSEQSHRIPRNYVHSTNKTALLLLATQPCGVTRTQTNSSLDCSFWPHASQIWPLISQSFPLIIQDYKTSQHIVMAGSPMWYLVNYTLN